METPPEGTSNEVVHTRYELYMLMRNSGLNKIQDKVCFLKKHILELTKNPDSGISELNQKISTFASELNKRWVNCYRKHAIFTKKNKEWLEVPITLLKRHENLAQKKRKRGRPTLTFQDSSERTKRQKTSKLRALTSTPESAFATQMSLRSTGKVTASNIVKEIVLGSPTRARKYKESFKKTLEKKEAMTAEDAVALIIDAKLTRYQYNLIREKDKEIFPSYKNVQKAKKECYPACESIKITTSSAEVDLQSLLDHTANRLVKVQKPVIESLNNVTEFTLVYKWGFDGSSGFSSYKIVPGNETDIDESVFFTSIVPIRLVSGSDVQCSQIIWQNPRPSSTRFCRPIRMQFIKETTEISIKEKEYINQQIQNLQSSSINLGNQIILVHHRLVFAMIDGKICNALSETKSTQYCYLCGASSKQFNNITTMIARPINESYLDFGISLLHAWIRTFECLLHISYKLAIKKWQARGDDKAVVAERKKKIQKDFRTKLGLIVDKPKQGFGNSNDGNTARSFFRNSEDSAKITGIDSSLIAKLHLILITLSCGFDINLQKFKEFCLNVARDYVRLYSWYHMPPTLHKILIHSSDIIKNSILPIGQLSEEAQEARNKDLKSYRRDFSRKFSRLKTNEDMIKRLLVSSDPVISSLGKIPKRKMKTIPREVIEMLETPKSTDSFNDDDNSSVQSSDEGSLYSLDDDHII